MPKIKIDKPLYEKIKMHAGEAGYSSPEEFIEHILTREVEGIDQDDQDPDVIERLKGLGYIS